MSINPNLIFFFNLGSTLFMTGLIWFVQIVHYPLFAKVGKDFFVNYENQHTNLTTLVVGPPMLLEAFSTVVLLFYCPSFMKKEQVIAGIVFLGVIWLSTALLQVPQHNILGGGFQEKAYHFLVSSNWLRTIFWSLRRLMILSIIYEFSKQFK